MRSKLLLVIAVIVMLAVTGCSFPKEHASTPKAVKPFKLVKPKSIDLAKIKPNELGKVLILEYHDIGDKEERWTRTADNFRRDLERLYKSGYRPISLRDYVNNNINVPAGKYPVVFTFDDATLGQFNYIYANGEWKVNTNCAVAIIEDFHRKHPDWPAEATFYIYYPLPFRQKDLIEKKLRHITSLGMDIGNHTFTHTRLDLESDAGAVKEMALSVKAASQYAPDAIVDSIALPYGKGPKNRAIIISGEYEGVKYNNIAALLVGAEPAPSPISTQFDPYKLPRVQAIQSELEMWLGYFNRHPDMRYVSDGDPDTITVPSSVSQDIDKAKIKTGKTLRIY